MSLGLRGLHAVNMLHAAKRPASVQSSDIMRLLRHAGGVHYLYCAGAAALWLRKRGGEFTAPRLQIGNNLK